MNKKKSKKKWIIIGIIAVVAAAAIFFAIKNNGSTASEGDYDFGIEAMPLSMQDLSDSINVTGKVESQSEWVATTDVTAKVKELNVSLGDRVESGDVLCTFDETEVEEQIAELEKQIAETKSTESQQNETAVKEAKNTLSQAKLDRKNQIATAKAALKTARKAYKEGIAKEKQGLNDSELLSLLASVESAEGDVTSAQNTVTSAEEDLEYAQTAYQEALSDDTKTESELLELKNNITKAQAALTSAQSALKVANTQLKSAQAAYNEGLSQKGITSSELSSLKDAVDSAERELESVKSSTAASVESAQTALESARNTTSSTTSSESELSKLKRQLSQMSVVAEQSGVVTQLNISKGSIPNGALMKIEDDSALKVNVTISEKDIVKIKEGMSATITSNALPDEEVNGLITQVVNFVSADSISSTGDDGSSSGSNYSANIELDPGSGLLLGMSVKVNIAISDEGESLAVPYDSIAVDDNGESYICRGIDNGDGTYTIENVTVTLGDSNDYYTAVEGDLAEGDLIILYPYMVSEGESIELTIVDGTEDLITDSDDSYSDDEMVVDL